MAYRRRASGYAEPGFFIRRVRAAKFTKRYIQSFLPRHLRHLRWQRCFDFVALLFKRLLKVVAFFLIGGALLYLYLRERHLGCYTPVGGKVCLSDVPIDERYRWFGTKTDYNLAVQLAKEEFNTPLRIQGCQPVLFYLFQRHSTRYPDREDIESAKKTLTVLAEEIIKREQSHLCKQDLFNLSGWVFPFVPDQDNMITPEGLRVVDDQVRRLSNRFPSVFHKARRFDTSSIHVDFTSRHRTAETAYAFMTRWFTDVFDASIEPEIRGNVNDNVLQFHRECQEQQKKKGKDLKTPRQVAELEASSYYSTLLETLSSRAGRKISKGEMKLIYKQCAFETAIIGYSSWCAFFTKEDLKLLEFREDLDDYYKDAYGRQSNWQQACRVAQDLFEYIAEVESPSYAAKYPQTVLHFSHAGAIKKVFAYFGVAREDSDSSGFMWDSMCSHRQWRSSQLSPFNANILFVMFSCDGGSAHKIAVLLNERLIQLPACSDIYCSLTEFREAFYPFSCNMSQICS